MFNPTTLLVISLTIHTHTITTLYSFFGHIFYPFIEMQGMKKNSKPKQWEEGGGG